MLATIEVTALILALAAFVSAVGGIASTIMALRKNRDEQVELCRERLKEARAELEAVTKELHDRKMADAS